MKSHVPTMASMLAAVLLLGGGMPILPSMALAGLESCGHDQSNATAVQRLPSKKPTAKPAIKRPDLTKELNDAVAGKIPLKGIQIHSHWAGNPPGVSVDVYGRGIGIWNRSVQFDLTKKQVLGLLKKLQKAKFTKMPPHFGGLQFKGPGPRPGVPESLKGQVTLSINGKSQSVIQAGGGRQSQELAALAIGIINACVEPARKGTSARNLADGLKKIAAGKLDPLTLSVLVHRIQGEGVGPNGWLMRVQGNTVTVRERSKKGYGPPIRYALKRKELEKLMKLLLDNQAASLPINLFAEHYTDFRVGVLQHEKSLQARRFARMTPKTHGERQKQFDRIFAALDRLRQIAIKKGR